MEQITARRQRFPIGRDNFLTVEVNTNTIVIRAAQGVNLQEYSAPSNIMLFQFLREHLSSKLGDQSWATRYAAEIREENLPMLVSPVHRKAIVDLMLPYRDMGVSLRRNGFVELSIIPSAAHYIKDRAAVSIVMERERSRREKNREWQDALKASSNQVVPQETGESTDGPQQPA